MDSTELEQAVAAYVDDLVDRDLLRGKDLIFAQVVKDLARAVSLSSAEGKASSAAMAVKPMLDALDRLPDPDGGDGFAKILEALNGGDDK